MLFVLIDNRRYLAKRMFISSSEHLPCSDILNLIFQVRNLVFTHWGTDATLGNFYTGARTADPCLLAFSFSYCCLQRFESADPLHKALRWHASHPKYQVLKQGRP